MMLWPQPEESSAESMPVSPEQAIDIAQRCLDAYLAGAEAGHEADEFYNFITLPVARDDLITGTLSVNGYSRKMFVHSLHGKFVTMSEGVEDQALTNNARGPPLLPLALCLGPPGAEGRNPGGRLQAQSTRGYSQERKQRGSSHQIPLQSNRADIQSDGSPVRARVLPSLTHEGVVSGSGQCAIAGGRGHWEEYAVLTSGCALRGNRSQPTNACPGEKPRE